MRWKIQHQVVLAEMFGIDCNEFANADTGIVHECENCVVASLEIVGTAAIDGGPEGVELVGFEPHTRLNFGIYIIAHG
jgi:hypothetical protein